MLLIGVLRILKTLIELYKRVFDIFFLLVDLNKKFLINYFLHYMYKQTC